jgi:hypothetical protein
LTAISSRFCFISMILTITGFCICPTAFLMTRLSRRGGNGFAKW